jgi:hypothetical protein
MLLSNLRLANLRLGGRCASGQIDDRLGSLTGEMGGDHQQHVVVCRADIRNPLGGNAVAEEIGFREVGKRSLGLRGGCWLFRGRWRGIWISRTVSRISTI